MRIVDLGLLPYRDARAIQERAHEQVLAGGEEQVLLVQHPPVITFGRRPGVDQNLRASAPQLAEADVEVVQSDRGGDITFHGPGQLVVYPIIRLADHGLSVSGYVHQLEEIAVKVLGRFGIETQTDRAAVGVWATDGESLAKICAIGVRIRRGISLHGLALNVTTDLRYFDLIVPCGLVGRAVTSMRKILGNASPGLPIVNSAMIEEVNATFAGEIEHLRALASFGVKTQETTNTQRLVDGREGTSIA